MAINPLNAISSVTTGISSANGLLAGVTQIANLLVATPQVQGYAAQNEDDDGLEAPLLFHYEGEQTFSLESDITDYFSEDNSSLQDHIALQPELVTTQGFIGELTDIAPNKVLAIAKIAAYKLTNVAGYLPALSVSALIAYNEAAFAYNTFTNTKNSVSDALSSLSSSGLGTETGTRGTQTNQQTTFQKVYQYWQDRRLFTIQTPWQIMENMAIKSVRATQDADSQSVSTFEMTFKQMNFATSQVLSTQQSANRLTQAVFKADKAGGSAAMTPTAATVSGSIRNIQAVG